jgi:short-subunit dehydrogenase
MKIAVVTGASSGLGKEFVMQISKHFSGIEQIWVIARRVERLEELKAAVPNKKIFIVPLDLTLEESYEEYRKLLKKHNPRIKMLVNCSGYGKIVDFNKALYDEQVNMIDVNCKALVAMTKLSIPYMYSNSYIINMASIAAFIPMPKLAVYSATKSFVLSFTRAIKTELKSKGIKVTVVCPGPVSTEFFDVAKSGQKYWSFDSVPKAKAYNVVKKALKDTIMGREVSVYGLTYKALGVVTKLIPHGLFLRMFKQ